MTGRHSDTDMESEWSSSPWSYAGTRCPDEQSETQRSSLVLDTTGTYDHKDLCTARAANVARPMYIRLKRAIDGERYSLVWCLLVNGTRFRTGGCRVSRLVRPRERCLLPACLLACLPACSLACLLLNGLGSDPNGEESEKTLLCSKVAAGEDGL